MNASERWECGYCFDDSHTSLDSARNCCEPRKLDGWFCEECDIKYELESDAESCCQEDEEEE